MCTEAKPSEMYCIFLPTMMQLRLPRSMENVFPFCVFVSLVIFQTEPVSMFFY